MIRNTGHRDQGFTLLEVMLAMVILAFLSLGIAAGLSVAIRAWESGERNLEYYQARRIVVERLISEISNAINQRGRKEEDDRLKMLFDGQSDRISFISTASSLISPGYPNGLKECAIYVTPGEGLVVHEAMFTTSDYFNSDRGTSYVLDEDVRDISFRYHYIPRPKGREDEISMEGEWVSQWGPDQVELEEAETEEEDEETRRMTTEIKSKLPLAVEVTLSVYNRHQDTVETWEPFIVALKEARALGVSVKRRKRV